jgi:hypothetical protein
MCARTEVGQVARFGSVCNHPDGLCGRRPGIAGVESQRPTMKFQLLRMRVKPTIQPSSSTDAIWHHMDPGNAFQAAFAPSIMGHAPSRWVWLGRCQPYRGANGRLAFLCQKDYFVRSSADVQRGDPVEIIP